MTTIGVRHLGQECWPEIHCSAHYLWNLWIVQPYVVCCCGSIGIWHMSQVCCGCKTNETGRRLQLILSAPQLRLARSLAGLGARVLGAVVARGFWLFFLANSALHFMVYSACANGRFIRLATILIVLVCEINQPFCQLCAKRRARGA